ncbi:MAG: protein kinase [Vicinamibacteria bacterium]|nr:protein kinase [Vicinamibacteria bacterium]
MPLAAGTRLGRYEILAPLGAGGMGEVYRARDGRLGREVALKVLPASVAADPERLERFEHEARVVASLNHPNVVTLHSVEDDGGTRFLTLELVEGVGLERHVVPGGLPPGQVREIGIAVADALAAAHERGIVHRDLKPANVMPSSSGRVKVLDFGLAKLAAPPSGGAESGTATLAAPLSAPGQVMGTVPYMAPEQVRGEEADPRTDVFALGVLLYELSSGRRPFQGPTAAVVCSAILRDAPPPLASLRADLPAGLEPIVLRCLEKQPAARYPSARAVGEALRGLSPSSAVAAVDLVTPAASGGRFHVAPPAPSTALLGREETLATALARVRGGARLLTVTGYGGTGKTRFAIELFERLRPDHPDGAAFASLASVTAAAEVLPAVATALAIPEAHGRSALDALCTVIGDARALLVLDNLEQVLDAAAEIAALVARCPRLQVVATSRAPLKVGAEVEFPLPPLELPPSTDSLEVLRACPSVALLVQRAEKVKPGFALTAANAAALAGICRRLDGLPLALELAAARVRILEPAALLQRLDHALDLLTSGDRDLPLRQRTLRATVSWSYSLLQPAEQRVLRQMSTFHEGFTLAALEQACFAEPERWQAVDHLDSLVEKGLVRVADGGERYALLETIRAFAAEQLHAAGETEAARDAHAAHFGAYAAAMAADFRTPRQVPALHAARVEDANLHAALHWWLSKARGGDEAALERGLLLAGHLDWYWHVNGQHLTARVALDALLAMAAGRPPSLGRSLANLAAGMVATVTGEWERSLGEWTAGFEDAEAIGHREAAAEGRMGMSYCLLSLGRVEEAAATLDDAIARSRGVSDFLLAISIAFRGMIAFSGGDTPGGIALVREARAIQERIADHEGGGIAHSFLAQMTFASGDPAGAFRIYEEAAALFRGVDHPELARVQSEMGWTALATGDASRAARCFREAVLTNEAVGSARGTGLALLGLAAVEAAGGRAERAVAVAAAARALSERAGVVVAHPLVPGLEQRIEQLKAGIPREALDGLVSRAAALTPAAVLALLAEPDEAAFAAEDRQGRC